MGVGLHYWGDYTHFMLTLIAVLDPFMAIPAFLGMRTGRTEAEHRRLASVAALIVLAVLITAAITGDAVLHFLGTSMASFRVAGGLVLLMMALAMLQAHVGATQQEVAATAGDNDISTVVPLAIPLLAGPGALSTVMIAVQGGGWLHQGAIIAAICVVCLVLWVTLRSAVSISRVLGTTGLNIANRLLGLLLAAIAVESMAEGLKLLFPALSR